MKNIRVKEFLNYQEGQDGQINIWLTQHKNIEVVDIKYSVGCFPPDDKVGWHGQEFSGALIIYKEGEE